MKRYTKGKSCTTWQVVFGHRLPQVRGLKCWFFNGNSRTCVLIFENERTSKIFMQCKCHRLLFPNKILWKKVRVEIPKLMTSRLIQKREIQFKNGFQHCANFHWFLQTHVEKFMILSNFAQRIQCIALILRRCCDGGRFCVEVGVDCNEIALSDPVERTEIWIHLLVNQVRDAMLQCGEQCRVSTCAAKFCAARQT